MGTRTKTQTQRRKPTVASLAKKLKPTVHEPEDANEKEVATVCQMSVLALRLNLAAGVMPPDVGPCEKYLESVDSMAAVGRVFDVSERTVATWKSTGMPVGDDGKYYPAVIRHWRKEQNDPPEWLATGNPKLAPMKASGDLVRAILRMLRADLAEAGRRAREDFETMLPAFERNETADLLTLVLAKHFEGFRLKDEAIEELLVETWDLV